MRATSLSRTIENRAMKERGLFCCVWFGDIFQRESILTTIMVDAAF